MKVQLHTKLKHVILSYYFAGGWRNAFKSGNIYSLYYVDLFSGDGICYCDDIDDEIEKYLPKDLNKSTWAPSIFSLMRFADEANFNLKCIFNDKCENSVDSLLKKINEEGYSKFVNKYYHDDANLVCDYVLKRIDRRNIPSLFFIDPLNHNQLKFSTIEKIAKFKDKKTGRMPELIINFMIHSILMAYKRSLPDQDIKYINEFLGTKFTREELIRIKDDKKKTHKIFLEIYLEKLKSFGYHCNYHLIKSTKNNAPIYYLIFATFDKKISSWYNKINVKVHELEEDWIKLNYIIKTMSDEKKKGQTFLDVY